MFLATDAFLPLNAVIRLEIDLPEDGGRIPVTCRVVFVRDKSAANTSGKPAGMGIQFLDLADESLGRLAQFLSDRSITATEREPERVRALDLLVVEDDRSSAERLARSFRLRGDRVRIAQDGLHALAECLKRPPDAVISDVQMPRMDGWQLIRILRSRPSLSSVPVLFLTQLWSEEERLRGYKLGVDDFIPKPSAPDEVMVRVDRAVDRAQRPGPTLAQRKTLRGDLEQVSLASLLSFLELEKKTGVLLLVGTESARIYVEAGRPLKIELDGPAAPRDQRQSMNLVLDWTAGQFEFGAQDVACADELRTSLTSLLLEHARLRDEARR
jgi:DNA-binding response OmpR family regulator